MKKLRAIAVSPATGLDLAARAGRGPRAGGLTGSASWLLAAQDAVGPDRIAHIALLDDADTTVGVVALQHVRAGWRSGVPGYATLSWPFADVGYGFRPCWLADPGDADWVSAVRELFPDHRIELRRTAADAVDTVATAGAAIDVGPGAATWTLSAPGSSENWHASLQGKHRRDLAKYRRDIARDGGEWIDTDAATPDQLAVCFRLHRARLAQKGCPRGSVSAAAERFLVALARATSGGAQRLTLLRHDDRYVAGCLSFVHERRLTAYVSGWDRTHARWDLGRQVLYHQILAEFPRGLAEIDFLGGDLAYKREFGLRPLATADVVVHGGRIARLCSSVVGGALRAYRGVRAPQGAR